MNSKAQDCLIKSGTKRIASLFILLCMITQTNIYAEPLPLSMTVKSRIGAGYFAELSTVVATIKGYEPLNLKELTVDWSQEFFPYKDDPYENGWDLYFEPIVFDMEDCEMFNPEASIDHSHFIHDQLCIHHWMAYNEHLPYRQSVNRIWNKYLKIKQQILDELSSLYQQNLEGYYCIGVHVRWGVAHNCESPKGTPTIESYITEVSELMQRAQTSLPFKIYLATDSDEVIQEFERHFPKELLFYLPAQRSPHREESHLIYDNTKYWQAHPLEFHNKKPGYRGGVTVLLDCLLMSKCDVFIHSTSNVAEFVSFISPTIQSVYLPKDDRTWPCRYGL